MSKIGMGLSLLKARCTGERFPFLVNWAITGRCNLRCRHCYGAYGEKQDAELAFDVVARTIDELAEMGTRRLTLEGGEPLVRKDIAAVVEHARKRRIEVALCTNGVLLPKRLDELADSVDLFVLSLDGREPYNDWLRGKGTYRGVIEALEALRARKLRPLLFCCLIDRNLDDIDHLVQIAREYGAFVTFTIVVSRVGAQNAREEVAKEQDDRLKTAIREIVRHKRAGAPVYYSLKNYAQALHWPSFSVESYEPDGLTSLPHDVRKFLIPCSAGRLWCYIECNGDLYPCYQLVNTLPVKNVAEQGVREAFRHLDTLSYCAHCYNLTLSELNLQARLDPGAVLRVVRNYFFR